jgi:endonuclease/exonuclease/phosphatase family metal-dependent hydrolase
VTRGRRGAAIELLLFALGGLCFLFVSVRQATGPSRFVPVVRQPGVLRVVTWNLGTGVDAGARALRREDFARVAAVLQGLDPDIVFLQELAATRQMNRLRARLGPSWKLSSAECESGRLIAVMARGGSLVELDDFKAPNAHAVDFVPFDGPRMPCVVVHADAFNAENRNGTLGASSDYLQARRDSGATILAGDLNLDLGLDRRGDLFSNDEYLDVETYNFLGVGTVDVGLGSGATAEPDRRLDYIFVEEGEFEVLQAGPWAGQRTAEMDHHPVVVDLRPVHN